MIELVGVYHGKDATRTIMRYEREEDDEWRSRKKAIQERQIERMGRAKETGEKVKEGQENKKRKREEAMAEQKKILSRRTS